VDQDERYSHLLGAKESGRLSMRYGGDGSCGILELAVPQVKAVNQVLFLSLRFTPRQYHNYIDQGQFDYLYDKVQLYDLLRG